MFQKGQNSVAYIFTPKRNFSSFQNVFVNTKMFIFELLGHYRGTKQY